MAADKPTLKPPPTLGGRGPGHPGAQKAASGKPSSGMPPLVVGRAPAPGPGAAVAPRAAAGARVSVPPAPGGAAGASVPTSLGPRPPSATAKPAPAASITASPGPKARPALGGGPSESGAKAPERRAPGIRPSRLAQEARPPKGMVRSSHALAEVIRAAHELAAVLVEENAALRDHNVDGVRALAERKAGTTRLYRERMLAVQKDPAMLTDLPEDERAVVKQMGVYLDAHLSENASLLKATMQGTQRLMDLMVQAAKQATEEKAPGYAADGRLEAPGHVSARLAMTFNETL